MTNLKFGIIIRYSIICTAIITLCTGCLLFQATEELPPGPADQNQDTTGLQDSNFDISGLTYNLRFDTLDYKINLQRLDTTVFSLNDYSDTSLIIFYVSATCPHCQDYASTFSNLGHDLEPKGYIPLMVFTSFNNISQIQSFNTTYGNALTSYWDYNWQFSDIYGIGYVPIIMILRKGGPGFRYTNITDEKIEEIRNRF